MNIDESQVILSKSTFYMNSFVYILGLSTALVDLFLALNLFVSQILNNGKKPCDRISSNSSSALQCSHINRCVIWHTMVIIAEFNPCCTSTLLVQKTNIAYLPTFLFLNTKDISGDVLLKKFGNLREISCVLKLVEFQTLLATIKKFAAERNSILRIAE